MSVKVGIIMGSDSDLPVMSKAAEILDELQVPYELTIVFGTQNTGQIMRICKDSRGKRPFSDYCRCRRGSPSSGDDCGYDGAPCYWCTGADKGSWRCGFSLFYRPDATGHTRLLQWPSMVHRMQDFWQPRFWPQRMPHCVRD